MSSHPAVPSVIDPFQQVSIFVPSPEVKEARRVLRHVAQRYLHERVYHRCGHPHVQDAADRVARTAFQFRGRAPRVGEALILTTVNEDTNIAPIALFVMSTGFGFVVANLLAGEDNARIQKTLDAKMVWRTELVVLEDMAIIEALAGPKPNCSCDLCMQDYARRVGTIDPKQVMAEASAGLPFTLTINR